VSDTRSADEHAEEWADEGWEDDWVDEAAVEEPTGSGRSLLSASAAPAIGTALSRVTGLMRVAALTAALGLTTVADVYNLANTAPNILYELVIGGVLSSTLVPLFIHANDAKAVDREDDSASVIVTVSFVAITLLTVVAVLLAPWINRLFSLSLDGTERARQAAIGDDFLILLLPQIFFYGI
jgi:putative peptidoglycan lipid II flippase